MKCLSCQTDLPEKAKFCASCGSKVALCCPACGSAVNGDQSFCANCGERLKPPEKFKSAKTEALSEDSGDRRVVTVLFTDVSGFTSMSEKLDPEEVSEIINQFFTVLTQPVYKYGGVVDKYIGDAIMALFGAPVAHEDDPVRAVSAAWEMQLAAKEFAAKLLARTGIHLQIRVGINTGLVVAGAVGGAQKQDYTVMGDAVNLAQRMEANASLGGVLVSQETFSQTKNAFSFQEREPIKVKGKQEPVKAYDLAGPKTHGQTGSFDQGKTLAPGGFVGRKTELERLMLSLEGAEKATSQLAILSGEAGIGKSRLVQEFSSRIGPGWATMLGRCPSWTQESSYAMIADLLSRWLDLPSHPQSEVIVRRLQESCALYCPEDLERSVSLLGHLLSLDIPHRETSSLSPQQKRSAAFWTLNDLLCAITRQNPLALFLEDLHWIDQASLDWLRGFAARVESEALPLLLVLQHRPTTERNLGEWGQLDLCRIRLQPLTPEESAGLAGEILETPPSRWPSSLKQLFGQIGARAEGNPLYLTELLLSLIHSRVILKEPGGIKVMPLRAGTSLPTTINGVVASRLDTLGPALRSLLQVASVIGRSFHPRLLASIYPVANAKENLEALAKAGFLHPRSSGEYAFNQVVLQEVTYQSILLSTRRKLHHSLATALEEMLKERAEEQSKLLAFHWSKAENPRKSSHYLFLAGNQAKQNFSNQEAISYYRRSLEWLDKCEEEEGLPDRLDIFLSIAEIETTIGAYAEAQAFLKKAAFLAPSPLVKGKIFFMLSGISERKGDFEAALAPCEEGIGMLLKTGGFELAQLLYQKGWMKLRQGDYQSSIDINKQALTHFGLGDHRREMAKCYNCLGACFYRLNHWQQALESHKTALRLREEADDIHGAAISHQNLGAVYFEIGEWNQAADNYQRSLAIFQKVGDITNISAMQINLGDLLCNMGKLKEAEQYLRQTLELNRRVGNNYLVGLALCAIGNTVSLDGRTEEAIPLLKEGVAILESIGAVDLLAEVYQIFGRVYLSCENWKEGLQCLAQGTELAKSTNSPMQIGVIQRLYASYFLRQEKREEAEQAIKASLELLSKFGSKLEQARAWFVASRIFTNEEGEKLRKEAIAVFRQLDAGLDLKEAEN
ncbi:MAG TPA: hypothetical protein DD435_12780 [Cyanobacteria bacterium UBA8530]|nr:hypothetical protein [Cyanobacteria bacterium UBA8530]